MDVCFILLGCFGQVIVLALASFFFGRLAWPFLPLRFSINEANRIRGYAGRREVSKIKDKKKSG